MQVKRIACVIDERDCEWIKSGIIATLALPRWTDAAQEISDTELKARAWTTKLIDELVDTSGCP